MGGLKHHLGGGSNPELEISFSRKGLWHGVLKTLEHFILFFGRNGVVYLFIKYNCPCMNYALKYSFGVHLNENVPVVLR